MTRGALIPARPTATKEGCTCLWREEQDDLRAMNEGEGTADNVKASRTTAAGFDYKSAQDVWQRSGVVNRSASHMPGSYVTDLQGPDATHQQAGLASTTAQVQNSLFELPKQHRESTGDQTALIPKKQKFDTNQQHNDHVIESSHRLARKTQWSAKSGQMADRHIPDLLIRKVKKNLSKSTEHKLRELISYKAELLNTLRALVPKNKTTSTDPNLPDIISTSRSSFAQTHLCECCLTQLQTYLFFSPVPRSTYLYEHSVSSYLSLLDDAISASNTQTRMESITHHELSSILHAELSVVEWRLSLKLARFHKRTGYLAVFPMEIGDYADLEIKRALNKPADGIMTAIWRKVRTLGSPAE